jgi:hypothetical protein
MSARTTARRCRSRRTARIIAGLLLFCALIAGAATGARAQDIWFAGSWIIGMPTSDTREFIDATSFRGIGADLRQLVNDAETISAGFYVGWQLFHEETFEVVPIESGDASGRHFRYLNAFPLLVNMHYYPPSAGGLSPFVGGNVGAYLIEQRTEFGFFAEEVEYWHFGLAPEVGLAIGLTDVTSVILYARWNWAAEREETGDYSWLGIHHALASGTWSW